MKLLFILTIIWFTQLSVLGQSTTSSKLNTQLFALKNSKPDSSRVSILSTIADTYISLHQSQKALNYLKNLEAQFPSKNIAQSISLYSRMLAAAMQLKRDEEAKQYADKLKQITEKSGTITLQQIPAYKALIPYYLATRQFTETDKYLTIHNELNKASHNTAGLAENNLWHFKLDSAQGNHLAALAHFRSYAALKDSVLEEAKRKQIASLDAQYHTQKKDKQLKDQELNIALLKKQDQLQRNHLKQVHLTQNITIGGAAVLFMLSGVIYSRYRLKQIANKKLQAQQDEINHKNEALVELAQQKDILLEEKEWLIKEIHHRVKNNLQIVISLLNTQSAYLNDDRAHAAIRESQHRMQSIAFIHQKLYQSESRALIEAHIYINELIDYLSQSFDIGRRICFEKNLTDLELDVSRAVPIGLILNEAITNSIKYAFPNEIDGCISISLCCVEENSFRLSISDNGVGLPDDFEMAKCRSLGMNLMRGLCKQIGSSLILKNDNGVSISVDFKDEKLLKPNLN
ncbi:sensor histidine kinase [Mucilaginibacter celer]|uniref:histidine kinase n=1 Tax=Mucilaginibacter celer TaxID=2305508 RepID=A0A494VP60_9SPHI|nr:sensor histidine kinase [Mucilaginibacter celer]AYL94900.1 sensor histidine kinase [Mucilaginibacter celer]